MDPFHNPFIAEHTGRARTIPLEELSPANPKYMEMDVWQPYFSRLREEAPLHYCEDKIIGPYWSLTRYKDIMATEVNTKVFSSSSTFGGITLMDQREELPMFIAMDQPKHDEQRKVVQPIVSPQNLESMEKLIRERTQKVLDALPLNETFNWVEKVSIDLTNMMLATLFDFPFEDRALLTYWSDSATANTLGGGYIDSEATRERILAECLAYFTKLWNERVNAEPGSDLVSMLAHGPATRNMSPREYLGNLVLLIVGGNDTTRNSMTGGVCFLNQNPDEYAKLRANPALVDSMVSEIIRYQTPLAYMRRTALEDFEMHGQTIRKGDKLAMWYASGNRDSEAIDNPDQFIIDRARPRQHLSFGFGIHRCVGNRLAELQLRILWEEILQRFSKVEVVGPPKRVFSAFIRGYTELPVRVTR